MNQRTNSESGANSKAQQAADSVAYQYSQRYMKGTHDRQRMVTHIMIL